MSIVERTKVIAAYRRAVVLGSDHAEACAVVARALGLDADTVSAVVRNGEEMVS